MNQVILHSGPRLLRVVYPDSAPPHDEDVTERAVEFLFDRLELGPDVRLRDLFGLFERCPPCCRSIAASTRRSSTPKPPSARHPTMRRATSSIWSCARAGNTTRTRVHRGQLTKRKKSDSAKSHPTVRENGVTPVRQRACYPDVPRSAPGLIQLKHEGLVWK